MANKNLLQYEPGDLIASRYQVISSIGEGGMASVWKATDIRTQNDVAVKVSKLPPDNEARIKTISRYRNELSSFASLSHTSNVVKLYDMIEKDDILIIVMECVEGGTMSHRFREYYDMTLDELKFYFSRLCNALQEANNSNIVHRDIKLDNILIGLNGEIKLGDFGISILKPTDLEAKSIIGTPKYISPEVGEGEGATHLSDIYSLGILMYECATGIAPFVFKHTSPKIQNGYMIQMQKFQKPIAPRMINKKIPQELENLILQMIEKKPEFRPQSAKEVRDRLIAIDENAVGVKPYVYKSKMLNNNNRKKSEQKVGIVYDYLNKRFRSKFSIIFWMFLIIILVGIIVEMAVLI